MEPGAIAHYSLLERLEPAGPGELYRARDTRLGRTVTVRLLPADFAADAGERAAFIHRAGSLATLSHPNVTAVFDVGEHAGRLYVVFEFLRGQLLRAEMAGRVMNVRRAVELAIQIADAVADAHAAGFVHGGLSPDTIVITAKGHAKIPAFELATRGGFAHEGSAVTLRDYDSPEEARGQQSDERSDIYTVGAVLYEMLTTRRPPHRGAAAPSAANTHAPRDLDDVVLRAVAPNPELRCQSAAALAAELRAVAAILDVRGVAGDEEEHADPPAAHVGRALTIALLILLGLGLLVWWAA
ncbi:MAG: serine/threonine protein kinase [Acidobacteria bacterium]|nr:serine/threonine protein kinase [Acidobacteriota bacterium]